MKLKKILKLYISSMLMLMFFCMLTNREFVHAEHAPGDCGGVISMDGKWEIIGDMDDKNSAICLISYLGEEKTVIVPNTLEGHPVTRLALSFWDAQKIIINGKNLKRIYFDNDDNVGTPCVKAFQVKNNPYFSTIDGVLFDKSKKTLIAYPGGKKGKSYTIPKKVVTIDSYAFTDNKNLKCVRLPKSVKSIGTGAFQRCRKLEKVDLNQVKKIGIEAFSGCVKLKTLQGGGKIIYIGDEAFCVCDSLKQITLGKNVKSMGNGIFSYARKMKKITLKMKKVPKFYNDKEYDDAHTFSDLPKNCKIYVENEKIKKAIKKLKYKGKVYVKK